jgi:selenocysteine-specific elongation factor
MFVIGTAGHIDHGKSTLVKALTGIDPDRLPEEKERGLTIDLGFAWFDLPSGESVGVVDVPGHERFIKNMVAGVGGIDAVIFVIAADDGWMPQSTEHLDILSLLGIKTGIVVLTKTDLVEPEYLELQKKEIALKLKGSFLEKAPIIPFSAKDNLGKQEIINSLQEILQRDVKRVLLNSPRLFIDRSFIIKGIGTVVTGTLLEGELQVGQELEICPSGIKTRIRSLQTHKHAKQTAMPGSRVAAGLIGINKEDAPRGSALVIAGQFSPTKAIGAKLRILASANLPVENGDEVFFLLGTAVVQGKIKLFGGNITRGNEGFAAIHLNEKICCRLGDRFIIRRISPAMTIGGGTVLDWNFAEIKLKKSKQLDILKTRQNLDIALVINSELQKDKNLDRAILKLNSCFTSAQIDDYLAGALNLVKAGGSVIDKEHLDKFLEPALKVLEDDHRQRPWSGGMAVGELSRKLRIPISSVGGVVSHLLASGKIAQTSGLLKLKEHLPHLTPSQKALAGKLHAILSASPLAAPLKKEFIAEDPAYEVVINFLKDSGEIIELKGEVLFTASDFQRLLEKVVGLVKVEHRVTASQIKDYLGTTRKYVIPLLEKLDSLGITVRDGDFRILGKET